MAERILPTYVDVGEEQMKEAIGIALGRASVCWDPMDCTGVFQEDVARQLAGELMGLAHQFAGY